MATWDKGCARDIAYDQEFNAKLPVDSIHPRWPQFEGVEQLIEALGQAVSPDEEIIKVDHEHAHFEKRQEGVLVVDVLWKEAPPEGEVVVGTHLL